MFHAERGLFELRRGRLLLMGGSEAGDSPAAGGRGGNGARGPSRPAGGSILVAAVDGLGGEALGELRRLACAPPRLVITRHRGRAMGLAVEEPVSLRLDDPVTPAGILALSSARGKVGGRPRGGAPAGPAGTSDPRPATAAESAGLALARLGRLLPALVVAPVDPGHRSVEEALAWGRLLEVAPGDVRELEARTAVEVVAVSEAPVPLEETEEARFILFRETPSLLEHVAILIGDRETWPDPVPVRLHSACLTGDLFGSLRCDCGEQLHGSLRYFAGRGGGLLLYLAQEGRGIGLGNKLRAYTMQQEGLDTVEADGHLGFGPDERRYVAAVQILERLGVERVELLTNNPEKVRAVEEAGIAVVERRGIHGTLNRHNTPYVEAKVAKAGHWLGAMLRGGGPEP